MKLLAVTILAISSSSGSINAFKSYGDINPGLFRLRQVELPEVSFFGDIFGASALKADCIALWNGRGYPSVDGKKCARASKEIDFAEQNYPRLYSLALRIRSQGSSQDIGYKYRNIQQLEESCRDKSAIRSAKTVRYWGTTEVGGTETVRQTVITRLAKLKGADHYKILLQACDENSWLSKEKDDLERKLLTSLSALSMRASEAPKACDSDSLTSRSKTINQVDINKISDQIESVGRDIQLSRLLKRIELGSERNTSSEASKIEELLGGNLELCKSALQTALVYQKSNQQRRANEEYIKRRQLAEQRRVRAEQEERRKKQAQFQKSIDSVILE